MPWVRSGDTSATYPPVMRVAGLSGADGRSVNEVFGFVARLAMQSSAHLTDYVVDAGTVGMIGGPNVEALIRLCVKVKLLTKVRVDGMTAYKVVDDPDFLHLRLKAEIEWQRQQQADCQNPALAVPIRLRDGDNCRYCAVMVQWLGRPSPRTGTLDHLEPGEAGTVDTMAVACKGCNSELRDLGGKEREQLKPPPAEPFYSEHTADYLTKNGRPTAATQRPDHQPGTAPRTRRTTTSGQRAATQAAGAPDASDPAVTPGHRASPIASKVDLQSTSADLPVAIGTSSAGSGRVGTGSPRTSPSPAGTRTGQPGRRKRSRRARNPTGGPT